MSTVDLARIERSIPECTRCPRLVDWAREVADDPRAAYRDEIYWGRPVPGFGDPGARVLILGLAPGAHGANRTGRMFTGDRSGDWLFRALHRAGLARSRVSVAADDGQQPTGCYITSVVHCAPPGNRPSADEQSRCRVWLMEEVRALDSLRVVVVLGGLAFGSLLRAAPDLEWGVPRPVPRFGHGVEFATDGGPVVLCSYHPSQQNTFTGRLTEPMFDGVMSRAVELAEFPISA